MGDVRCPLVTGVLPTAVKLGFFDPAYAKAPQEAFIQHLRDSGADPAAIQQLVDSRTTEKHLGVLAAFIEEHFDAEPKEYETTGVDFERLFALTEAELLGYHGLLRYRSHMPTLAEGPDVLGLQIKLVLCGTLISAIRDIRCEYHDALARWLEAGDLVVSFNYDLLMDRSLAATGSWYHDDGYGLTFTKHGHRVGDQVEWREPRRTRSAVKLLKPHGSLNWLYPRNSWDSVMNLSLQPGAEFKAAPPSLYCIDDVYSRFEEDYPAYEWWEKYDIEHDDTTFDLHALLIPPSVSKPYRSFEGQMGTVWGAVTDALLGHAEELFIVGYSLRPDDIRTHWLLRKAARQGEKLKRIVVVDPSDEVLRRATDLFAPIAVTRLCSTMEEFAGHVVAGTA